MRVTRNLVLYSGFMVLGVYTLVEIIIAANQDRSLRRRVPECCMNETSVDFSIHFYCLTLDVSAKGRQENVARMLLEIPQMELIYGYHSTDRKSLKRTLKRAKELDVTINQTAMPREWLLGKISLWISYLHVLYAAYAKDRNGCVVLVEDDAIFTLHNARDAINACYILKSRKAFILRMGHHNTANVVDLSKFDRFNSFRSSVGISGPLDLFTEFHGFVAIEHAENGLLHKMKANHRKLLPVCACKKSVIGDFRIQQFKLGLEFRKQKRSFNVEVIRPSSSSPLVERIETHNLESSLMTQGHFSTRIWNRCIAGENEYCVLLEENAMKRV